MVRRPIRLTALLGLLVTAATAAEPARPAATGPADHAIKAPHYGDALFTFYQDQYFDSLTSLMVSQHFGRLSMHEDEAEVLRGGLLLSWGMHREAGEVFARLIERGAEPAVRDRAWFFLAKVRHVRGLQTEAAEALARIEGKLPVELETERGLLTAQVRLALGDHAGAAAALTALAGPRQGPATVEARPFTSVLLAILSSPFSGTDPRALPPGEATIYARYNLGVALIRSGDTANGIQWLDELGQIPAATEEQRAMRDQANLALGFSALQHEEPEAARKYLERIRLNGPASNKALLGFGWAAAALKKPRLALQPWTTLAERDSSDAAVLEARIAVPFALAELGADAQALDEYGKALGSFAGEQSRLDESIVALRSQPWLDQLLEMNPGDGMAWLRNVSQLPSLPHAAQLTPALASHGFQEGFKNLRDLRFLQRNLANWQDKLGHYTDMLNQRRDAFAARLPTIRAQAGKLDVAGAQQRLGQLSTELDRALQDADGRAFADPRQRELTQRLERSRASLADKSLRGDGLIDPNSLGQIAERLDRMAGALHWELVQALPERQWQATRALRDSALGLPLAAERLAALEQAERDETERFGRFGQRITELTRRIQALQAPLTEAGLVQAAALQEFVIASLANQKERLAGYSNQARYAMAQLHDQSRLPKERVNAEPR